MRKGVLSILVILAVAVGILPGGILSVHAVNAVAMIEQTPYETLQEAIDAAGEGDTVVLVQDISDSDSVTVSGKILTLALNGHALGFAPNKTLEMESTSNMKIFGPGIIVEEVPSGAAVSVTGTVPMGESGYLFIREDVVLQGYNALSVESTGEMKVIVEGALFALNHENGNAGTGLHVSGDGAQVIIAPTARLSATGHGIYCAGDAVVNMKGGTVTGDKTGIEMRAGDLLIEDGTVTANADMTAVESNADGATTVGAGVAIAKLTAGTQVGVTVVGGNILGHTALNQADPGNAGPEGVDIAVHGGLFSVIHGGETIVNSTQLTEFIHQGFFRRFPEGVGVEPGAPYLAAETHMEDLGDRCLVTEHTHDFDGDVWLVSHTGKYHPCKADGCPIPDSEFAHIPEESGYMAHSFTGENGICTGCDHYPVWVVDVAVTPENMSDVLGDGKVSYDPATKTLHLNDAVFGQSYYGIYAVENITVEYSGTNVIDPTHIVIWAEKELTLKGGQNATLALGSDFGGIATQKKLVIDGGSLNISAVTYGIICNSACQDFEEVGLVIKNNAEIYARVEVLDTDRNNSALVWLGKADTVGFDALGSALPLAGGELPVDVSEIYEEVNGGTGAVEVRFYVMDKTDPESYAKTLYIKHTHSGGTACESQAKCEVCGEPYGAVKGHGLVHVQAKTATAAGDGNIEHWYCETCGKYFTDSEGTDEIAKAQITVKYTAPPPTGDETPILLGTVLMASSALAALWLVAAGSTKKRYPGNRQL